MTDQDEQRQSLVYILADQLFTACEAGNNLINCRFTPVSPSEKSDEAALIYGELDAISSFIKTIESYEDVFSTKINQARKWARYLRNIDSHFKPIIDLFMSATKPLAKIDQKIQSRHDREFDAADHYDWFFDNRHISVVKGDDGFIQSCDCDETYLIAGELRLFEIIELSDQFLSALETRYAHLWHTIEDLSNEPLREPPHYDEPS